MSRRNGVITAFVDRVDAERGRVTLRYKGIEDNFCSGWVSIASPMSGSGRGQLFMPEKDDEVLVAFADAEFDHPYVIGFLWNGEQKSPETEATNRVIVTPGGHQLRFEDKENDTRIILQSKGEHSLTFEDAVSGPQVHLASKGERELLLDDTPGQGKVTLSSTQHDLTMDDTARTVKIDAGSTVTITMDASAQSLTIVVGGNTFSIGQSSVDLTAVGSVNVTAGGSASVTVGGSASITTGGAASVTIGGAATVTAGGAATITAGGAVSITGSAISVTAGVLSVSAGVSMFSGVLIASTVMAGTVVGGTYTPSAGNFV